MNMGPSDCAQNMDYIYLFYFKLRRVDSTVQQTSARRTCDAFRL